MNNNTLFIVVLAVSGMALLGWAGVSFWQTGRQTAYIPPEYAQALQDELTDKCVTPDGYTDTEWQEHISHHPDRYQECLLPQ